MNFNTFDILYVNTTTIVGLENSHIQGKSRPVVIIQNNIGNHYAPTLLVMPLTSVIKKINQPTHGILKMQKDYGLKYDSMILAEQVCPVNKTDVVKKIGHIGDKEGREMVRRCYLANMFGSEKIKIEKVEVA